MDAGAGVPAKGAVSLGPVPRVCPVGQQDAWEAGSGTGPPPGASLESAGGIPGRQAVSPLMTRARPEGGSLGPVTQVCRSWVSSRPPSRVGIRLPAPRPRWPRVLPVSTTCVLPSPPGSAPSPLPCLWPHSCSLFASWTLESRPASALHGACRLGGVGLSRPRLLIFRLYVCFQTLNPERPFNITFTFLGSLPPNTLVIVVHPGN